MSGLAVAAALEPADLDALMADMAQDDEAANTTRSVEDEAAGMEVVGGAGRRGVRRQRQGPRLARLGRLDAPAQGRRDLSRRYKECMFAVV